MKAGTTAHWQRPVHAVYRAPGFTEVDLFDVLTATKMAQSMAEARRLIRQGRVWSIDERQPRRLTNRKFRPFPGERLVVGEPKFVETSRGAVLDVTKGKIVLFRLCE